MAREASIDPIGALAAVSEVTFGLDLQRVQRSWQLVAMTRNHSIHLLQKQTVFECWMRPCNEEKCNSAKRSVAPGIHYSTVAGTLRSIAPTINVYLYVQEEEGFRKSMASPEFR